MTTIAGLVNDPAAHHYAITGWACDVCEAEKTQPCRNALARTDGKGPIQPGGPLPGRQIHFARLIDRRRQPKGDE